VVDAAARLAQLDETNDAMALAQRPLEAVVGVRRTIIQRSMVAGEAYEYYRTITTALLDAIRLNDPPGAERDPRRRRQQARDRCPAGPRGRAGARHARRRATKMRSSE